MPRKKLKKILPSHNKIKEQKALKIFGNFLHKREIWSLSRKKVVAGVFIGVFVSFIPMPLQMVLSSLLAILFNANLPISFALIFISNPLTMPFLYYIAYEVGLVILNKPHVVEFNINSMYDNFELIAAALYTGSFLIGIICSLLAAFIVNSFWIYSVRKNRKAVAF